MIATISLFLQGALWAASFLGGAALVARVFHGSLVDLENDDYELPRPITIIDSIARLAVASVVTAAFAHIVYLSVVIRACSSPTLEGIRSVTRFCDLKTLHSRWSRAWPGVLTEAIALLAAGVMAIASAPLLGDDPIDGPGVRRYVELLQQLALATGLLLITWGTVIAAFYVGFGRTDQPLRQFDAVRTRNPWTFRVLSLCVGVLSTTAVCLTGALVGGLTSHSVAQSKVYGYHEFRHGRFAGLCALSLVCISYCMQAMSFLHVYIYE